MTYKETFGAGINDVIEAMIDVGLQGMKVTSDENLGQMHMGTIVMAEPGSAISGDEVAELLKESSRTGVPMAKLARRLKNVSVQTVIEPGPAVPEKAVRTPRNRVSKGKL